MFKISKSKISLNNTPKIIAEISANHNQDLNKAIRLIKKASQYGADFVKIQTYSPENLTLNSNKKDFIINNPKSPWNKKNYLTYIRLVKLRIVGIKKFLKQLKKKKLSFSHLFLMNRL